MQRQSAEKSWRIGGKWPNELMEPLFELKVTTAPPGSREVASHLFRLPPGTRLPATREARRLFGVSRNTAQDVYDRLGQDGLLSARHGSGTFVRTIAADAVAPATSSQPRV